jgi:hypothetical protein
MAATAEVAGQLEESKSQCATLEAGKLAAEAATAQAVTAAKEQASKLEAEIRAAVKEGLDNVLKAKEEHAAVLVAERAAQRAAAEKHETEVRGVREELAQAERKMDDLLEKQARDQERLRELEEARKAEAVAAAARAAEAEKLRADLDAAVESAAVAQREAQAFEVEVGKVRELLVKTESEHSKALEAVEQRAAEIAQESGSLKEELATANQRVASLEAAQALHRLVATEVSLGEWTALEQLATESGHQGLVKPSQMCHLLANLAVSKGIVASAEIGDMAATLLVSEAFAAAAVEEDELLPCRMVILKFSDASDVSMAMTKDAERDREARRLEAQRVLDKFETQTATHAKELEALRTQQSEAVAALIQEQTTQYDAKCVELRDAHEMIDSLKEALLSGTRSPNVQDVHDVHKSTHGSESPRAPSRPAAAQERVADDGEIVNVDVNGNAQPPSSAVEHVPAVVRHPALVAAPVVEASSSSSSSPPPPTTQSPPVPAGDVQDPRLLDMVYQIIIDTVELCRSGVSANTESRSRLGQLRARLHTLESQYG